MQTKFEVNLFRYCGKLERKMVFVVSFGIRVQDG